MDNPAVQLHALFSKWKDGLAQPKNVTSVRGWSSNSSSATLTHIEAWGLLGALHRSIEALASQGHNVDAARAYFPRWGRMLASVEQAWGGQINPDSAFPNDALNTLQLYGTLIDVAGGTLEPASLDRLSDAVDEVFTILREDETISGELRWYLVKLAQEIRAAMEDETLAGGFDFRDAAERLWVAMHAAAGQSTDKASASKWRSGAAKLLVPAVAGVLTHAGTLGFDQVAGAITGGN